MRYPVFRSILPCQLLEDRVERESIANASFFAAQIPATNGKISAPLQGRNTQYSHPPISMSDFLVPLSSALPGENPVATQLSLHATSRCRRFRFHRDMRYTVTRPLLYSTYSLPPSLYLDKTTQPPDSLNQFFRRSTSRRQRFNPQLSTSPSPPNRSLCPH